MAMMATNTAMIWRRAAALLVQGSAHVYSKKVEYLHQLVYQALDVISDRK